MTSADAGKLPRYRIRSDELTEGAVLAAAVRDRSGRILLSAGQRVTAEHLAALKRRGSLGLYIWVTEPTTNDTRGSRRNTASGSETASPAADPEAPREPSPDATSAPEEIIQALRRRHGHERGNQKRLRRSKRHDCAVELTVVVVLSTEGGFDERTMTVTTCDVSKSGLSFACMHFVPPGSAVYARFEQLGHRPVVKGIVRNCVHTNGRTHRVGVEFVPLEPDDRIPRFPTETKST